MERVAFIDLADNFYDRHAVYALASVLTAGGHEVHYIPKMSHAKIVKRVRELKPSLLLYSSFTRDIPLYARLDALIKREMEVKSLIGGHGATYDPEYIQDTTIDALCIGEGDTALLEYVDSGFVADKNIVERVEYIKGSPRCMDYHPFINLDDMPLPERALVYEHDTILRDQPSKQFMAGRGCPYRCTYCHNHAFNEKFKESGPVVRFKSVDYLLEEIKDVKRRFPLKTVVFQDDVFILKRDWLFEFCERFPREVGLPFTCNVKAEIVVKEEVVEALKHGGCIHTAWSIESGNDHLRNNVLKRNMTREQILKASENLNKYKIYHRVGNVIGLPGEKFENVLETVELNIEAKPDLAIGSVFVPYPGLELTDYALKHNYLDLESANNLPATLYERSVLNFSPEDNLRIQKIAYLFPLLVQFPRIYYNKTIFNKVLLKLPRRLLRIVYDFFFMFKMASFFKVKPSLRIRAAILYRYLANTKIASKAS